MAAVHRTEKDIEGLKHIIDRQKSIAYDDPELIHLDSNFHTAVAEASKNRLLASFVLAMHRVIHQVLFLDLTPETAEATAQQHLVVSRAIIKSDGAAAATAMEKHLDYLDQLKVWREKSAG